MEAPVPTASRPRALATCALTLLLALAFALFALPAASGSYAHATRFVGGTPDNVQQPTTGDADLDEGPSEAPAPGATNLGDGTYYGSADGFKSVISVAVTVKSGYIEKIDIVSQADDPDYMQMAEKMVDRIVNWQSTDIDTVTGATYSSRGIRDAVSEALSGQGSAGASVAQVISIVMLVLAVLGIVGAVAFTIRRARAAKPLQRRVAVKWQRASIQLLFFALTPSVFASAFMGLKNIFLRLAAGSAFKVDTFLLTLIALCVFTVIFGRFFCGYVCAFGFFGDLVHKLGDVIRKKLHFKKRRIPYKVARWLACLKYLVLVGIIAIVAMGASDIVNDNSPWTAFSRLSNLTTHGLTIGSVVVLVAIVIGMLFEERFFCRFLCPLGAIFSFMPTLPTGRVRWNRPMCYKGCNACQANCPVNINPKNLHVAGECIQCGNCIEVCPADNIKANLENVMKEKGGETEAASADAATDGSPAKHRFSARDLLTRPWFVLVLAVLMVLIFWFLGIARFLPELPWVG